MQSMKLLLDFLPIVLFFGAYKMYGVYIATGVLMAATTAQMGYIYYTERRLETMQKVTLAMILVFGTLTIALHDERFIKWKPTFLYAGMAIGLAVALWVYKKNFLHLMLGRQLTLPYRVWMNLNVAWIGYCVFMSITNGYVAAFYSTDDWINFKLWGYAFPVLFLGAQAVYIARHVEKND
jgi:intracellular septation protein